MSNGKLLTLFLDYENELRATMPDFAHQLSALLNVPPKVVDYSKKAVAAYEDFNIDAPAVSKPPMRRQKKPIRRQNARDYGTKEKESEKSDEEVDELKETLKFHDDFEKNVMFLMDKSDATLASMYKNHFDDDANRDTMIAQLADNFSTEELQKQFDNLNKLHDSTIDTNIDPHCGVRNNKKKKKNQLIEMQFCEACDVSHADHFRFCDLCNEEHDGCCDVLA